MIDYNLLNESIEHYSRLGYVRIEAPWTVSAAIDDITRPTDKTPYELVHNHKRLVASGEQSFLYLMLKGFLPPGKYQAITPCFRDDSFDMTHSKYFMKNELINTLAVTESAVEVMYQDALSFFEKYFENLEIVGSNIENSFDIDIQDTELGSYALKQHNKFKWVSGTGCAEPRTSNLIKQYGISSK